MADEQVAQQATRQKLDTISDYFGLGVIKHTRRAMGTNQNYLIATDQGQYLVKIIVNTAIEEIESGLPFLERLQEYGFPAAYYLKAAHGSAIYHGEGCDAVVLRKLKGKMPDWTEEVCREVGINLAKLHLIPVAGMPPKRHWLDNDYLPEAIEKALQIFGAEKLSETLKEYEAIKHFRPAHFPQSIIHGDLDLTNCLFIGKRLSAFLDWQEVGISASVLDFGSTVLGFCFIEEHTSAYHAIFAPNLYKALYDGYTSVRPFSQEEEEAIEAAVKYMGLTQPVWSMLHWDQYHPGQDMVETNTLFWAFGLDTFEVPE